MTVFGQWALATVCLALLLQGSQIYGKIVGPRDRGQVMLRLQGMDTAAASETGRVKGWSAGMGSGRAQSGDDRAPQHPSSANAQAQSVSVARLGAPAAAPEPTNLDPSPKSESKPDIKPARSASSLSSRSTASAGRQYSALPMSAINYTGIDQFYKYRDDQGEWQYATRPPQGGADFMTITIKPGENIIQSLSQEEIDRLLGRFGEGEAARLLNWLAVRFPAGEGDRVMCYEPSTKDKQHAECVSRAALIAALSRAMKTL